MWLYPSILRCLHVLITEFFASQREFPDVLQAICRGLLNTFILRACKIFKEIIYSQQIVGLCNFKHWDIEMLEQSHDIFSCRVQDTSSSSSFAIDECNFVHQSAGIPVQQKPNWLKYQYSQVPNKRVGWKKCEQGNIQKKTDKETEKSNY